MLTSTFDNHELSVTQISADAIARPNSGEVFILCALLFLLTLTMVLYRRKFSNVLQALYSQRFFSLLTREGKALEDMLFPLTLLFDMLTLALGLLTIVNHFYAPFVAKMTYWGSYAISVAVMTALYFVPYLGNLIYAGLYDRQKDHYALNLYKFIFLTNVAVALFVFLIIYHATQNFIVFYVFIPLFIVLFGLFLFRLLKISAGKVNLFHFFIYFCTLEILPYLVLVKLIAIICKSNS